jgi:hypothetical protein
MFDYEHDYEIEEENLFFHYCSLDTLIKIIETDKIRLCNPYKMNDSKELSWFFELLPRVMEDYISKLEDEEVKESYKFFYEKTISQIYEQDFFDKVIPYVACFSEQGDILSQWRAYSDDGKGVSIGFNLGKLVQKDNSELIFKSVCYDLSMKKNMLLQILDENGLNDPSTIKFHRMKHVYTAATILIYEILTEAVSNKNLAFFEEREGRLIFFPENGYEAPANKQYTILGPFFRSNGDEIISYYELDFSKVKDGIIDSIYIGPKCKTTEFDIQLLLDTKGYKNNRGIAIKKSKASYR